MQLRGAEIRNNVRTFGRIIIIEKPSNLKIGDFSTLNEGVILNYKDRIYIGKYVRISSYVQIHTGGLKIETFPRIHYSKPVIIEDNVWLASEVIVNPGAKIEKKYCSLTWVCCCGRNSVECSCRRNTCKGY